MRHPPGFLKKLSKVLSSLRTDPSPGVVRGRALTGGVLQAVGAGGTGRAGRVAHRGPGPLLGEALVR